VFGELMRSFCDLLFSCFKGYVESWAAFVIGIILGLTSWLSLYIMKEKLHVDDALDVGSVHGEMEK
jgi:ammonia channel protein AmtB